MKCEIRNYILEFDTARLPVGKQDPKYLGSEIGEYLDTFYKCINTVLINGVDLSDYTDGQKARLKLIFEKALIDYKNPNVRNTLEMDLRRWSRESGVTEANIVPLIAKYAGLIGAISVAVGGLAKAWKTLAEKNSVVKSNAVLRDIFDIIILPELRQVIRDIFAEKITDSRELSSRFDAIVDRINETRPELSGYIIFRG